MTYIKPVIAALAGLATFALAAQEPPRSVTAVVTSVTDGDILWVRVEGQSRKPMKLRLRGLDAPEICQAGGLQAKTALQQKVLHRTVRFATVARDSYQRTVADVWLDGNDVAAWMVSNGFAWSYRFHERKGPYAAEEAAARAKRLGVFASGDAMEPGLFRKRHGPCER